ncbi:MAG: hypothetical protein PHR35_22830, partial [Kiritimatiellae bacterium]|nr:hypothetical protein [Kiritimatiellia bacterium]
LAGRIVRTVADAPPWNYGPMISQAALGLLPTTFMLAGAWKAIRGAFRNPVSGPAISAYLVAAYLGAVLYQSIALPYYGHARASYTLGVIPCYAVLAAHGFRLPANRWAAAGTCGLLACSAVAAWAAYFVI